MTNIKQVPVADLIPYVNNARTHSDAQVAQIAASIKEFGFTNPILTDGENGIIAGHGRVLGAKKLGLKEVPVIELSHLSKAQKKAYILADNKLALNSGWDETLLKLELSELDELNFNIELTGFEKIELANLFDEYENNDIPESSTKEIDTDEYSLEHTCPKCGFEFNE